MAIVNWCESGEKTSCMKYIPIIPTSFDFDKSGVSLLSGADHVLLYPGWNTVHDSDWQNARQHCLPLIRLCKLVEKGTLVPAKKAVLNADGTVKEPATREEIRKVNLKTFPEGEAITIINNCNNPGTIKEWITIGDSREFVKRALDDRRKMVEKKVPTEPEYAATQKEQWQVTGEAKPEINATAFLESKGQKVKEGE